MSHVKRTENEEELKKKKKKNAEKKKKSEKKKKTGLRRRRRRRGGRPTDSLLKQVRDPKFPNSDFNMIFCLSFSCLHYITKPRHD